MSESNLVTVDPIKTDKSQEYMAFSEYVQKHTGDLAINSDQEETQYAALLQSIKLKIKEIEDWRKSITKPLDIAKKAVMDTVRTPLDRLTGAESLIKASLLRYFERKEAERAKMAAKINLQAEAQKRALESKAEGFAAKGKDAKAQEYALRAEMVQAPIIPETQAAAGISFREVWSAEIVDEKLVPREWLVVNIEGLNKLATATKGSIPVPGVKFVSKKVVAAKAAAK